MKKFYLFLLSFIFSLSGFSQSVDIAKTIKLVSKNSKEIGLTKEQLNNYSVSSAYTSDGFLYSYLTQSYKGLLVHNQMIVLSSKGGAIKSKTGIFLENIEVLSGGKTASPSLTPVNAATKALTSEKIIGSKLGVNKLTSATKFNFGKVESVTEDIAGELTWVPIEKNAKVTDVKLVWMVMVAPKGTDNMWTIMVDANTGEILGKQNATISDKWDANAVKNPAALEEIMKEANNSFSNVVKPNSPSAVANASYLVIPFPAESPIHTGGSPAVRSNPWAAAVGNASSLGWHSDGTVDYTISRGNNVWATEDQAAANQNTGPAATSSTSPDLTFNFPPNFATDPRNAAFQQFACTNLFY